MQSSLRIGRIGPLTINLNYTWLLAATLILWWIGLLWLPENFPDRSSLFYWSVAIAVLLLFFGSVILHELIHSAVGRTGNRSVNLFPFGSGMPFGVQTLEPAQGLLTALAAPVANLLLGILFLVIGEATRSGGALDFVAAIAIPLGWLNIALGAINFIPGTPFDGGWALRSFLTLFAADREAGGTVAGTIGRIAALALVLWGAWLGLTSDSWLLALGLVLVGWAAREAASTGIQRRMLRNMFDQVYATSFMAPVREQDVVSARDTVADMVRKHPNYGPDVLLPVRDDDGHLVGVTSIGKAATLLQGAWPSTPVTALMTRTSELDALPSSATLNQVLSHSAMVEARNASNEEEAYIPVVDNGQFVGSINPGRLLPYEELDSTFGIEDTASSQADRGGLLSILRIAVPIIMVIAFAAILGNLALRTNPAEPVNIAPGSAKITFSDFTPAEGAIVGTEAEQVSVRAVAARPIVSATIKLDGEPLDAQLSGALPMTQTITAGLPGMTQGIHTIEVIAGADNGTTKSAQWQFRVSLRSGGAEPTPGPAPLEEAIEVVRYNPAVGGRVMAGRENVPLIVVITGTTPPTKVDFYMDGQVLPGAIAPVSGDKNRYGLSAEAPAINVGDHYVRVVMEQASGSRYDSSWFFTALEPDENNVYFEETGFFVVQPFLQYWRDNGGLGIFGYPISYRLQETDKVTGEVYTVQYFERARFELHPSQGNNVILGRLGALTHAPEEAAAPIEGAQFFPETGHNLAGPFLEYWNSNGGLALFGYPISEERTEKNPVDGKEYTVQYFERNRFELHPEQAGTPFEVQIGLLGRQVFEEVYR
ncbi:MAG: hypothetical protein ABI670_13890 [Chloroflexota bacterium]